MKDITLYRYEREPNKITTSTEKPNKEYTILHRLIAEDKMILYKNGVETPCIDTDDVTGWQEKFYEENETNI